MIRLMLILTLSLSLLMMASTAGATILNVPEDHETIVAAIDATEDGDTVLVQPGIYLESLDFQGKAITVASLLLTTDRVEYVDSTIIDTQEEQSGAVIFENDEDENSILTGFTIQNGQADNGGGVFIHSASPTISHCLLQLNTAEYAGGGIYISNESDPLIEHCQFYHNESGDVGGGIAFYGNSTGTVNDCSFRKNSTENYGGAFYSNSSNPVIANTEFLNNESARNGGAIHVTLGSEVTGTDISLIKNSSMGGGAICLFNQSQMTLTNVVIDSNSASAVGSGIQCGNGASLILNNATITNNLHLYYLTDRGGGIYCHENSEITINTGVIAFNIARNGNAIYVIDSEAHINQVLVINNNDDHAYSFMYIEGFLEMNQVTVIGHGMPIYCTGDAQIIIANSILWNEGVSEIYPANDIENVSVVISYSDLQGGIDGIYNNEQINVEWLDGMIDEDPLFSNPDESNFNLTAPSPCIDNGNPEDEPDADGSRIDMGATPFLHGTVQGYLRDAVSGEAIANGRISNNDVGVAVNSNDEGFYQLRAAPEPFTLHVESYGYNSEIREGLEAGLGDVLEESFDLAFGFLVSSVAQFDAVLLEDDNIALPFSLTNTGNGNATYTIKSEVRGDNFAPVGELLLTVNAGEMLNDRALRGATYGDGHFYVVGSNNRDPVIYVFNREGIFLRVIPQLINDYVGFGMRDIEWNDGLLWGAQDDSVYGFTPDLEIIYRFQAPTNPVTCVTVDPVNETIWLCSTLSNLFECTYFGEVLREVDTGDLRIYGIAFHAEDVDDSPLYIANHNTRPNSSELLKMNLQTENLTRIDEELINPLDDMNGISISLDYLPRNWTLCRIVNDGAEDRLEMFSFDAFNEWMRVEPSQGQIASNEQAEFTLTLNTSETELGLWEGDIVINHPDARGGQTLIPVMLDVALSSVDERQAYPAEFGLTEIYPNPFNSTVKISFNVAVAQDVSLKVYDLSGRLVKTLYSGASLAGAQSIVWNANDLATGTYICRLAGENVSQVRKIVLLR